MPGDHIYTSLGEFCFQQVPGGVHSGFCRVAMYNDDSMSLDHNKSLCLLPKLGYGEQRRETPPNKTPWPCSAEAAKPRILKKATRYNNMQYAGRD